MKTRSIGLLAASLLFALGATAATPRTANAFASGEELGFMIGGQAGLHEVTPGGFKLFLEYGHRFTERNWFNLQLNFAFGDRGCYIRPGNNRSPYYYGCGNWSGSTIELIAGVKMKFVRYGRLVPYAKIGGGINFVFFPFNGEKGIAPVGRGGGGVKYYVLPSLALGGEMNLAAGPMFAGCGPGCSDVTAYVALDFAFGLEWNF